MSYAHLIREEYQIYILPKEKLEAISRELRHNQDLQSYRLRLNHTLAGAPHQVGFDTQIVARLGNLLAC